MKYADKLRDPRWQRIRLKVFERDNFACRECGDTTSTLHVHHVYYFTEYRDPWDYPFASMITLCESCHKFEHQLKICRCYDCAYERHIEAQRQQHPEREHERPDPPETPYERA